MEIGPSVLDSGVFSVFIIKLDAEIKSGCYITYLHEDERTKLS